MYGYISVPLYDTLSNKAIEYILKLAEVSIVIATADKTSKLLEVASQLPKLKRIIVMDALLLSLVEQGRSCNVEVVGIREAEAAGRENPMPKAHTNQDTIATLCFTSGTLTLKANLRNYRTTKRCHSHSRKYFILRSHHK
jgi:long-chain acyl-CoA synthetase